MRKHDKQCTFNVIQCVHIDIVAVEEQHVLHNLCVCVYNLSYPTVKAHAPYYIVICSCMALPNFPTSPHAWRDSRKNVTEYKMCVLIFFTDFV
jgi:hypothetical protein